MVYPRELPSDPKKSFEAMHEFLAQELVQDVADNVRIGAVHGGRWGEARVFGCVPFGLVCLRFMEVVHATASIETTEPPFPPFTVPASEQSIFPIFAAVRAVVAMSRAGWMEGLCTKGVGG